MQGNTRRTRRGWTGARARRAASGLMLLVMLAGLLGTLFQTASAQTYLFQVVRSTTDLYVNEDGTVSVEYSYLFANDPRADPIDAVDVGVPANDYDLSSVSGAVNGQPVTNIENSSYVKPGVALNLGRLSIQPGERGEVTVRIGTVNGLLFKANTEESEPYASFRFNPNYFGDEFVRGATDMTVTLHLPPGLEPNEPRYFPPKDWPGSEAPDETGYDEQNRVFYRWRAQQASSSKNYEFGAAFPARVVPAAALMTEVPFRFDGTNICPTLICLGFFGFIVLTIWGSITGDRKRKLQYLPPKLSVEGNGIKRGLTAIEAAILMEQPMDKILTMILFSVLKKGGGSVVSQEPLQVKVTTPTPAGLQPYETEFLQAMATDQKRDQRTRLQTMMTGMVKSVSEKMRGFSRKDTVDYYQSIMQKAWQQVESANTPEMKMKNYDEAMDWTMLDRRFEDRTRRVFGPQPVFLPGWWGRYDPRMGTPGMGGGMSSGPNVSTSQNAPPQGVNLPTLPGSDFAGSVVAGMQNFSSNVVGDLTSFTGGVTSQTNPPPPPPPTSRGGGGGGGGRSCACACACAGCACACAGGGR